MIRRLTRFAALASLLVLGACATGELTPAGPLAVDKAQYTLGRAWGAPPKQFFARELSPEGINPAVKYLTIDGPLLNRLLLSGALPDGSNLVISLNKEKPSPVYHAGAPIKERVEFISDSVGAMGYLRVEATNLHPVTISGQPGVGFELKAQTQAGLRLKGKAQLAEKDHALYVALFLAPEEYYFGAYKSEVDAIFASEKIN